MTSRRISLIDLLTVVSAVCAVLLTGVVAFDRFRGPPGPRVAKPAPDEEVENWPAIANSGQRIGPRTARVTIVEFGDYQCPACRSFHRVTKAALRAFPRDVSFVYRHMPLPQHPSAYTAAKAVECAALQDKFSAYHDWLYENDWLATTWRAIAQDVGVADLAAFDDCLKAGSTQPAVERDLAASESIKARATPAVIFNGIYLGARPDLIRHACSTSYEDSYADDGGCDPLLP